jgi:hypothetical protein
VTTRQREETLVSTDFQLVPTTDADPTPHDTDPIEQVTVPAPTPQSTTKPAPELDHTPGGLPAIPLAVITGNTTIASLSAVAVAAGPAAAAAAAGSVLIGAVAMKAAGARTARKTTRSAGRTRAAQRPAAPRTRQSSSSTSPRRTSAASGTRSASSGRPAAGRRTGAGSGTGARKNPTTGSRISTGKTGPGKASTSTRKTPTRTGGGAAGKTSAGKPNAKPTSRAAQIKALRKDKAAAAPTRKERRAKDLADKRALRDGRRTAKRDAKDLKRAARKDSTRGGKATSPALKKRAAVTENIGKAKGQAADTLRAAAGKTARRGIRGWTAAKADQARARLRAARDQSADNRTARIRQARRKAKARAALARNRTRARARFALSAAGRALLAAPVGLIGCLTTPLGRKLGWAWLQYPGRRLHRRLTAKARSNRDARIADANNTYAQHTSPESPDNPEPQPIADTVARAPRTGHNPEPGDTDMSEDIKLHFLETSEETVSAARAYEPGGMLHVRQVIKAMPVAIENWAMAFAVLAEKSDSEFPLGDSIGEGLDDIHQQLRALISRAEELAETFDRDHEADIDRLLNPRKSRDAERTWDTTANEDYDE